MDVLRPHLDKAPPAEVGLVNSMRYLDVKLTLGAGILTKLDRASMAVSLETRPVFLNRRVLDLAGRIPPGSAGRPGRAEESPAGSVASSGCRRRFSIGRSRGSRCRWDAGSAVTSKDLPTARAQTTSLAELVDPPAHRRGRSGARRRSLREDVGAAQPRLPPALAGEVVVIVGSSLSALTALSDRNSESACAEPPALALPR